MTSPRFVGVGTEKERVRRYVARGEPVLLLGPSGCGKTTLLREVAHDLGRDIVPVTGGPSLGEGDLLGGYLFSGEAMTWHDGPLVYAMRRGLPFFFDEIGKTPEGTLRPLYPLLDDRREVHLVGKLGEAPEVVLAAAGFCFMGAYTPRDTGSLPEAFLQRCRVVELSYLPADVEAELLVDRSGVGADDARYLVAVAGVVRAGALERKWRAPSTRSLLLAAHALASGVEREWAVRESMLGPLELSERDASALATSLSLQNLGFGGKAAAIEAPAAVEGEDVEPLDGGGAASSPDG